MRLNFRLLLILACFVLSGVAGLVYETAWTQQFGLVFGTSELAVAAVLAAYMAGLAAGATLAGRWVARVRRPLLVYAVLELFIALSALAVPLCVRAAARLQVFLLGGLSELPASGSTSSAVFYLVSAFVILLLPTGLMGATLPLLARAAVVRDAQIGPRIGLLYTANTLGAAFGTLLAAFVLLPRLGLHGAVLVGAALNFVAFLAAAMLQHTTRLRRAPIPEPVAGGGVTTSNHGWILPLVLVSGFVSLSYEVLWMRLLSHLLGSSIYAFGTMLSSFLCGIGLGSAAASRIASDAESARRGFVAAQFGIAVCFFAAFSAVDRFPGLIQGLATGTSGALAAGAGLGAVTLLPGAIFLGSSFPFAVRLLAGDANQAGSASARVYGWNTVGAIFGALVTGFVLLPTMRIAGTVVAGVAASLVLAAVAALATKPRRKSAASLAVAGLFAMALWPPATPWRMLQTSPLTGLPADGEPAYYGVGRSATVLLLEQEEGWRLTTNGLPESLIQAPGSREGRLATARWLSLLPIASRPDARSLLMVGLGAGNSLSAVPISFDEVHVVELEPEVIRANRAIAGLRQRDPLSDPRLRLSVHDARSALLLTERRFDAVVSQPSHPWTAGAAHLFTAEFFQLVRQRLDRRGVFVQWIGLQFVDEALLRSLMATLTDVFPHVEVYRPFPGLGLLFMASVEPLLVEANAARGIDLASEEWGKLGVLTPEDILIARVLDTEGARRITSALPGATTFRITDQRNLLQTGSPSAIGRPLGSAGADKFLAQFDPLRRPWRDKGLYVVRRLLHQRSFARAREVAGMLSESIDRRTALALIELASSRRQGSASRILQQVFEEETDGEAFYALVLLQRSAILQGTASTRLVEAVQRDSTARVVVEGWYHLQENDLQAMRSLEPSLAAIGPRHPLILSATRQRIAWRHAVSERALAEEALDLLDLMLALNASPSDLLLRARLAVAASAPEKAMASLRELSLLLARRPEEIDLARQALDVLKALPPSHADPWANRLLRQLEAIVDDRD